METVHDDRPRLTFRAGRLRVCGWPPALRPPCGLEAAGGVLEGPARLRWRVREALEQAAVPCHDAISTGLPPPGAAREAPCVQLLRRAGWRGLLLGWTEPERIDIVAALARSFARGTVVAAADSAAEDRWRRALAERGAAAAEPLRVTQLAREMHWRGDRHAALVVDSPELMPHGVLAAVCDGSAALARVGLVARLDHATATRWSQLLGPLLASCTQTPAATTIELRVPLPEASRERYESAWHTFLCAYDRFVAARGSGGGFGRFVSQARADPRQRPAVRSWHDARRLAAWHDIKADLVGALLAEHAGERLLVFTPDRRATYELARQHLMPAVTSEVPRRERDAMLRAFADGEIPVLAGPRLLDLGVPEASADVGILVGGGYGQSQREARVRRVRPGGRVYELTCNDTLEVGRARRWRLGAADRTVALHGR